MFQVITEIVERRDPDTEGYAIKKTIWKWVTVDWQPSGNDKFMLKIWGQGFRCLNDLLKR